MDTTRKAPLKKAFVICPVRGVDPDTWRPYVEALEGLGYYKVHWPTRDTDQNDPVGLRICDDNLAAIKAADAVFIIWDGKSEGCLFDMGMAFALDKPVHLLKMPEPSDGKKGFQNMMRALEVRQMREGR